MTLSSTQKATLHRCTPCGHLLASRDGAGCAADDCPCRAVPETIETTYAAVEALLGEVRP